MTLSKALGTYGNAVGVVTPLDHKLAQLALISKVGAGTNAIRSGLLYDGVANIVLGKANMSYDVVAFTAALSRGAAQGAVLLTNDGTVNVVTTAADSTNSRIDVIYAWPREFEIDGVDSTPVIAVAQGAPALSPVVPAIPAGALELARAVVPAGATATDSGVTITQTAPFTALDGAPIPVRTSSALPTTAVPFARARALDTGLVYEFDGVAWGPPEGDWVAYTPTFTNFTLGNGAITCRYRQAGKTVYVAAIVVMGSTSVMGSLPKISLPVTPLNTGLTCPKVIYLDTGTALVEGEGFATSGNLIEFYAVNNGTAWGSASPVSSTVPFTWVAGDSIRFSVFYEVV